MNLPVGLIIELLVCVLLGLTIFYCVTLSKRLNRLRADEANLRATISELVTATEIAERAIMGLRATASEADQTLGQRLDDAERLSSEICRKIEDGEDVLQRIEKIALAAKPAQRKTDDRPDVEAPLSAAAELQARAAAAAERLTAYRRVVAERAA